MTSQQLAHEIGILLLGGATCALIQTHLPIQQPIKQIAVPAVAVMTILYMARVAGLI